jgi:hypothetical protein
MPILPPSFTPPQSYNPFASLEVNQVQVARPRAANAAGAAPASPPASAAIGSAASPGAYNFGWTVSGADEVKPAQVFDDGAKVYVQFSDMKHVPAIFAETPNGRVLLRWEQQPPYAVIARPEQTLIFQMGASEARAQRVAAGGAKSAGAASPLKSAATTTRDEQKARAASTDALWYVTKSSTMQTAAVQTPAAQTTAQTAVAPDVAPPQTGAAQPTRSRPAKPAGANTSTDALWYITK